MRSALLSALLVVCACSRAVDRPVERESADGGTSALQPIDTVARLSGYGAIGRTLANRGVLAAQARGFGRARPSPRAPFAEITLPADAQGALHLAPRTDPGASIDVVALDVAKVSGGLVDDTIVYRDAAPATDLVLSAADGVAEETRLLRDERAPTTLRWALHLGPAIARAEVRDGMLELADARGYVHLATTAPFAVDAHGESRPLALRLEGTGATRTLIATLDAHGLAYPVAVDPVWTTIPSPGAAIGATILLPLASGKVLLLGGLTPKVSLYDIATNSWSSAPDLPFAFAAASGPDWQVARAAKLTGGNVLVVAGSNATDFGIFNDGSYTWTTFSAKQVDPCQDCGLAVLPDNHVFKVNGGSTTTTEVFDRSTNKWKADAPLPFANGGTPLVVALRGPAAGKVLVVKAGPSGNGVSAAVWTEGTGGAVGTWSATIGTPLHGNGHRGVALPDGRAFIGAEPIGGAAPPLVAEIFDPTTNTFKATSTSPIPYGNTGYAVLSDGMVLGAGGQDFSGKCYSKSAIYDPATDVWSAIDALPGTQAQQGFALLPSGSVLSVGGFYNTGSLPTLAAYVFTPLATGASCALPASPFTCLTGHCVDAVCCSSASCPNGVCNAPAVAGRAAGTCALNDGRTCTAASDCASGFCVDGVCCKTACTGQCEACAQPGTEGTCTPVVGAPIAPRPSCTGAGAGTVCGPSCDGTAAHTASCVYAPKDTVACGVASCTGGVMTTASKCDGAGACPDTSSSCGAYACDAAACRTTCTTDAHCAAGYYCDGTGTCVPKTGLGAPCTSASMCAMGTFCTDGVCCGVASCGAGKSCALGSASGPVALGTCSKTLGSACGSDAECGSDHCVDGVCCDTACTDQCAACDVTGKAGTCSPVLGAPHGSRASCDDGGKNKCAARKCDGTAKTSACNGFLNDGTVSCADARCEGDALVPAAHCDGAGSCATPPTSSCGKYKCDAAALACKTGCAADSDCVTGSICKAGKCTDAPTCSTDGSESIDPITGVATPCAPYRCSSSGACGIGCATSADCAPGLACDTSSGSGLCAAPSTTDSSGGCAFGAKPSSDAWAILLGLACAGLARRRRAP